MNECFIEALNVGDNIYCRNLATSHQQLKSYFPSRAVVNCILHGKSVEFSKYPAVMFVLS